MDQSIQLGEGGYRVLLSFYGFRRATQRLLLIAEGTYAVTHGETNGVVSLSANPFERTLSVAGSCALRAGLRYTLVPAHTGRLELAGGIEGVPVHDMAGGSKDFVVRVPPSTSSPA